MTDLILCIAAIYLAPLSYWAAIHHPAAFQLLNRLIFIVVLAFVVLRIIPDSFRGGGWWAIFLAALGFTIPTLAEIALRKSEHRIHLLALAVSFVAFMLHVFIDGNTLAIFNSVDFTDQSLKWLLIIHRIPESFVIWWITFPLWGWSGSIIAITMIAMVTVIGYIVGGSSLTAMTSSVAWIFQAILAGSLLHLGLHRQTLHK
jgi:hypothetical protein